MYITVFGPYLEIIFKILLAVVCAGAIGLERETKHRPAGFRTHILVCLGAMTVMALSEAMFQVYDTRYGVKIDPARLSAQVISGIGFLGAGTIIHYGTSVKGLTTAASLWVVAVIGLTIGAGQYFLATTVTITIFGILLAFNKFSRRVNEKGNVIELSIQLINKPKIVGRINFVIADLEGRVLDLEFDGSGSDGDVDAFEAGNEEEKLVVMNMVIKLPYGREHYVLINELQNLTGVIKVQKV